MGVKFILLLALLAGSITFLSSCIYEKPGSINTGKPSIYIIEESSIKTFVAVNGNDPLAWFDKTADKRLGLNVLRYSKDYQDKLDEFEIKSSFSRVVRSADGKTIFGYLKEADNPGFEKKK